MPEAADRLQLAACRYCASASLTQVLSLGAQPPSNSFLREEDVAAERRYPLDLVLCNSCSLAQLGYTVPPELIFDDYLYLSSTSEPLRRHYRSLALDLTATYGLQAGDLVVDIGCNDGILLKEFDPALRRVGIEPSRVAELARQSGLEVVRAFFEMEAAQAIVERQGTAKVVTATNVFAHVPDIDGFVAGLGPLLGEQGVFVFEASYLPDLIDGCLFDTIYHEHVFYLTLTPLIPFLQRHGLRVIDAHRVPFGASGPAFRVAIVPEASTWASSPATARFLEDERRWGTGERRIYERFADTVERTRDQLLSLVSQVAKTEAPIAGYGAPAKGNTLLNYLGLDRSLVMFIADRNAMKQGLLTPGSHIPVVSEEKLTEVMPDHALLLAWNYLDFFLENSEYIRRGGRFIVPLPQPRIRPT